MYPFPAVMNRRDDSPASTREDDCEHANCQESSHAPSNLSMSFLGRPAKEMLTDMSMTIGQSLSSLSHMTCCVLNDFSLQNITSYAHALLLARFCHFEVPVLDFE